MKPIFIMMIGLPGAGKSTIAKKYAERYNAIILSSDKIREELYGSEECQDNPNKVFELMRLRSADALKSGTNVIYDATNLSSKHRKHLLQNDFRSLDIDSKAVVVTASIEECIERQSLRDRKVPEDVIRRMVCSFEFPMLEEGWTLSPEIYNNCSEYYALNLKLLDLHKIDQKGKNHLEDAFIHSVKAYQKAKELKPSDIIFHTAAMYHDIGKLYTRSEDSDGNAHFYGHQNVSTYLFCCWMMTNGEISPALLRLISLIQYHDLIWQAGKKFQSLSEELKEDLKLLNECDIAGTLHPDNLKNISLLEFISFFPDDWKERIQQSPFSISVKESGEFILLKYSQLDTDFSYQLCKECRGCILTKEEGRWIYVCHPFDKFFNYGESHADNIDWSTARVLEKVDGSLMKVWWYNDKWHLSTNGTIDAFSAMISDTERSFGQVFEQALGYSVEELGSYLDRNYTYMFELTSPETRVVISYPYSVYYLSRRNIETQEESLDPIFLPKVKYPKIYELKTINNVIAAAAELTRDEEGFVVNDSHCRRIKVKGPEYLIAAKLTANHNLSNKYIYRLILNGSIDDLIAYAPEYGERVNKAIAKLNAYKKILEDDWIKISSVKYESKKDFAAVAKTMFDDAYLFFKYNNPNESTSDYIQRLSEARLFKMLDKIADSN